ncbi:citrate (Si)-synthase, partial [bacterium]|nr:citrate (Si)-synthase [bacterium]
MSNNVLKVRDERNGKELELPLYDGTLGNPTVEIQQLSKELGYFTYDPGFTSTASCKSAITFINGEQGILLYRGYPIDQLAEKSTFLEVAYLLMNGELPTKSESDQFISEIRWYSKIHEKLKGFIEGFHYDAHPMAMMVGIVGSLSAFYHSELDVLDPEHRRISALRMLAKMPIIAAACYRHSIGDPFVYPRDDLQYCENFLNMMFSR